MKNCAMFQKRIALQKTIYCSQSSEALGGFWSFLKLYMYIQIETFTYAITSHKKRWAKYQTEMLSRIAKQQDNSNALSPNKITACLSNSTSQHFFSIACLWMSIGLITVEFLVIGVCSQGVSWAVDVLRSHTSATRFVLFGFQIGLSHVNAKHRWILICTVCKSQPWNWYGAMIERWSSNFVSTWDDWIF